MAHFPIFLKSAATHALVVCGTGPALAKAALLLEAGITVTMIDPAAGDAVTKAGLGGERLHTADRTVSEADVSGAQLVYIDTPDRLAEERIIRAAKAAGIPVNVVDQPSKSSFITGGIVRRGAITFAISSGGDAPVFVRQIRAALEAAISPLLGRIAAAAGRTRASVKTLISNGQSRRDFWENMYHSSDKLAEKTDSEIDRFILSQAKRASRNAPTTDTGLVQLVGAGPGDADLLTLKAHRALARADVILYDRLVSEEVLSLARRDAERVFVGKHRGDHGIGQKEIGALMIQYAQAGKRVVRLKSGDPMIFGRAGEELEALRSANIPVEVVPGITALSASAARAQIPVTDRSHASSLSIVTAHTKSGAYKDYARLAGEGRTLAVYMGVKGAAEFACGLMGAGVPAGTPVAIIENATRETERRLYGNLAELGDVVENASVRSPAIFLIGDAVRAGADWPAHINNTSLSAIQNQTRTAGARAL